MKRRWFAVVGVVVLLGLAALVVALQVPVGTPVFAIIVAGSLLFVLGGLDPVPDVVPWYRFVAVGELFFGVLFVVGLVAPAVSGDPTTIDLVLAAAGVANALLFALIGVDWFLGGRHYDLSTFEPGPILGGRDDVE